MGNWKRWAARGAIGAAVTVGTAVVGLWGLVQWMSVPTPTAQSGPEAEALADAVEAAVNLEAWERTGAVMWTFGGRQEHLWDRDRMLARVRWDDLEALVDLTHRDGRAWRGDAELFGDTRNEAVEQAYAHWINDSFWLNPLAKLRDPGVTRGLATVDDAHGGAQGLLISYSSGGLTPGDQYLWHIGEDHLPTAYQMWVSIIPVGGFTATWEDWTTLRTGAVIAQTHVMDPVFTLELTEVDGAETLAELVGPEDPFAPLFGE